jgi:ABC transport system ATP-binding/permease protein
MLTVTSLSHESAAGDSQPRLDQVSFSLPAQHCLAVLGAAGSGKTLLVHILTQALTAQSGTLSWNGRDFSKHSLPANAIGYVDSQPEALHPLLNVKETAVSAQMLRVGGITKRDAILKADALLKLCGLDAAVALRVEALSLAQKRRLALVVALAGDPQVIVAQGFTEGLDARSSRELAVLLKTVTHASPTRVLVHAVQSLADLTSYDTVLVLHEGRAAFHGPGRAITHYFNVTTVEELYHRLAMRPAQRWHDSWARHRDSYYAAFKLSTANGSEAELSSADDDETRSTPRLSLGAAAEPAPEVEQMRAPDPVAAPSVGSQLAVLLQRSAMLWRRARWQSNPRLVAWVGLPLIPALACWAHKTDSGDLLAGNAILMVLVLQSFITLAFGVTNAAREAAGEREVWIRERQAGLSPLAYFLSKLCWLLPLALAQGVWLVLAQEVLGGGMPGNGIIRMGLMSLSTLAFTAICFAISTWSAFADQAASRAWMLTFANVVIGGALLGLPRALGTLTQPFLTSFYAWSGSVDAMGALPVFEKIKQLNSSWFATPGTAASMLALHLAVGLWAALFGVRRK